MKKIIHKIGNSFPSHIYAIGLIFILSSFFLFLNNPVLALIFLLVGMFICTSRYGVEIDLEKKKYREYGQIFCIKQGQWFDLTKMPYVSILKSKSGHLVYSRSNYSTANYDDGFDVCLLNESHKKRVVIKKCKTKEEALQFAKELESILDVKLVQFDPIISSRTAQRRR